MRKQRCRVFIGMLAAFRFAVLAHCQRDLRHRREIRRLQARELCHSPASAEHLVDLPRARRKAGIARGEGLETVIDADQSGLDAIVGRVEQWAWGSKIMMIGVARLGDGLG
jgi:hypothetical protein